MQRSGSTNRQRAVARCALGAGVLLVLSACGGGGGDASAPELQAADAAGSTVILSVDAVPLSSDVGGQTAQPAYHLAPVLLDAPGPADAIDNTATARAAPHAQAIPSGAEALATRGLTVQALRDDARSRALMAARALADGSAAPMTAGAAAKTYTPAQIRAAYGLPGLPAAGATPTAAQAAQLGAGQTIYLIDAMHDPNAAAELAVFNATFGLPACTTRAIAASASLPLAAAGVGEGCALSVVYGSANGAMTSTAPAFDAGWATEIALDLQWAHAAAPLARLVLIESPDASLAGLLGAVKLANAMGAGVVSMSFGAPEGNWTASVDASFAAGGMSYVAATGDSGSGVSWPAVSSNVLAVGGTSLTYSGLGPRSETTWAQSGGGISAYTPTPAYQSNAVPGVGTLAHRAVADVAFNADPSTGQYVAVMTPGRTTASWVSAGGTSLATPQWAGLAAVANAMRASAGAARLAAPHAALYTQLATVPGVYAATFADVQAGANGSCARCAAQVGYDLPTGLGTPNAGALLSALAGPAFAPAVVASTLPPSVAAAALTGTARTALTGSIAVSDPAGAALQVTITGVPAGMAFSVSGQTVLLSWPSPLAGKYTLGFTARNGAGLSGKAAMPVTIDAR